MPESPEIKKMTYTDEITGEEYEIFIETKAAEMPEDEDDGRPGRSGKGRKIQMQQATRMIRGYTAYVASAFRNFSAAQVEEVTISFGLKIGGKAGIPYITEGSAETNVSIQVKCSFPDKG